MVCNSPQLTTPPLTKPHPQPVGFSRQVVALLDEAGADYTTFDILSDEEVRQGDDPNLLFCPLPSLISSRIVVRITQSFLLHVLWSET